MGDNLAEQVFEERMRCLRLAAEAFRRIDAMPIQASELHAIKLLWIDVHEAIANGTQLLPEIAR